MAMTPEQMIALFCKQGALFGQGLQVARNSSNYELALSNVRESFKAYLMAALIQWRTGSECPAKSIADAVHAVVEGLSLLSSLGTPPLRISDIPVERTSICAFLINSPSPECSLGFLKSDRRLDALIANALLDKWDQSAWDSTLTQLRAVKGRGLAAETYTGYYNLLFSTNANIEDSVRSCEVLFERRAKDRFFSGGDQTYGGGPDNALTVDFRLAAILKKIDYRGDSLHRWRWS
jgi:hypothetical protein